jgi:hypothetical protein
VVVLGIAFALDVPVLDGANDVALVRAAQLNLDLIASAGVGVLQKQIEPPRARLNSFFLLENEVAQPEDRRVFRNSILHPLLRIVRVVCEQDSLRLDEFQSHRENPLCLVCQTHGQQ